MSNVAEIAKNTALWDEVFTTDPAAVRPITGKTYKGNSPKPMWLVKRATEVFGACGSGWGVQVKSEGFTKVSDTDTLHTAVVLVWYIWGGVRCEVEQMGGTKAVYMTASNKLMVDDDAGKKSVTDGMVKALSLIGFAGDIFTGRWDDSKYQDEAAELTADREAAVQKDKSTTALAKAQEAAIQLRKEQEKKLSEFEIAMTHSESFEALLKVYKDAIAFTKNLPDDAEKIKEIWTEQVNRFSSDYAAFKAKIEENKKAKLGAQA